MDERPPPPVFVEPDLTDRLIKAADVLAYFGYPDAAANNRKAADEIDRLRAEMATMHRTVVHECCIDAQDLRATIAALLAVPDWFAVGGVTLSDAQLIVAINARMAAVVEGENDG